jgi:putative transposase
MERARFTEEQVIGVLKEHEARAKTVDLAQQARCLRGDALQLGQVRRHGCLRGQTTEALEEENAKLKKLLAEQMLDADALRELLSRKW